jgi:hypothetical protein
MKYKCFWEKDDIVGGKIVQRNNPCPSSPPADVPKYLILSRGFSTGEPEFSIAVLSTGVVTMATFMSRAALAEYLTENDYEPVELRAGAVNFEFI